MEVSARLLAIKIYNFKSFRNFVTVTGIDDNNNLIGERHKMKQDFVTAVYFGLGAEVTELAVDTLEKVQSDPSTHTYVELTLGSKDQTVPNTVVRRTVMPYGLNEQFLYAKNFVAKDLYRAKLRDLGFDVRKQFHFFGALDRNFCWNVLTSKQDELIAVLSNEAGFLDKVRQYHNFKNAKRKTEGIPDIIREYIAGIDASVKRLQKRLPCVERVWAAHFTAYTISHLKREGTARLRKIEELNSVQAKLQNINFVDLQRSVDENAALVATKKARNDEIYGIFRVNNLKQDENVCRFKFRLSRIQKLLKASDIQIQIHQNHIAELERCKTSCEANIALMNTLNGTRKRSPVWTEDALFKLYPMFLGSDDLEMDIRELELLERQEELNRIEIEHETYQQFELLPDREKKQTVKDYRETSNKLIQSFTEIFNPNTYLHSFDEMKLELLHSKICSSKGFVLCKGLRPVDEQHKNLINNILSEFKDTIVLYRDDSKRISRMLKKAHSEWFKHVRFIVLTSVTGKQHLRYIPPPDHWLNYCKYNVDGGNDTSRSKLMYHLGVKHNIICVERFERVQREFQQNSKKYVASVDGQLIYTRNAMGIDVLMYFQPGKSVKTIHFPEACQRMKDSFTELSECMAEWVESENTPRDLGPDVDTSGLHAAIQEDYAKLKVDQINSMETLRQRLNEPTDVADVQDYADRLEEEQGRLKQINSSIEYAQSVIEDFRIKEEFLSLEKDVKALYIPLKAEMDRNTAEITLHEKTIAENETEIKKLKERKDKLQMEIEQLKSSIKILKYKTLKTVIRAQQEGVDFSTIECTNPNNLQDIINKAFVNPEDISIVFDDMTCTLDMDKNKIYARRTWYNFLTAAATAKGSAQTRLYETEHENDENDRHIMELKPELDRAFNNFNNLITQILSDLTKDHAVLNKYEYKFRFKYDKLTRTTEMIFAKLNGHSIGFDCLSIEQQAITYWLLFAALNQHSKAPFAFIDLLDVKKEIIECVAPIVEQIAKKTQLFIISSHIHHLRFADLQFVFNEQEQQLTGRRITRLVKHASAKLVIIGPTLSTIEEEPAPGDDPPSTITHNSDDDDAVPATDE